MKKILLLLSIFFLLGLIKSSYASPGNLWCGSGSSGTCPTAGTECSGAGSICTYTSCDCVVNQSQTIDANSKYNFKSLTVNSGVVVTINMNATGGGSNDAGSNGNGFGAGNGGGGGAGGHSVSDNYALGGAGGNFSGGGGGGGGGTRGTQPGTAGTVGGGGGNWSGGGGGGGNGGLSGGAGGTGGAGGGYVIFNATTFINVSGSILANGTVGNIGTAGGGYGTGGGGGAGGAGGGTTLIASTVNIPGLINSTGGTGGKGGTGGTSTNTACSGGGGGGGGGGYINISATYYYNTGTLNVSSGSGGAGGDSGAGGSPTGSAGSAGVNGIIAILISTPQTPVNGTITPQTTAHLNFTVNSSTNSSFPVTVYLDNVLKCNWTSTLYNNGTLQNCTVSGLSEGAHNWYANASTVYVNTKSDVWQFDVDTTPPQYSLNSTNSTVAGSSVLHSLNWTDTYGLSGYIFQFCNGTWNGIGCNATFQMLSNTTNNKAYSSSTTTTVGLNPDYASSEYSDANYGKINVSDANDYQHFWTFTHVGGEAYIYEKYTFNLSSYQTSNITNLTYCITGSTSDSDGTCGAGGTVLYYNVSSSSWVSHTGLPATGTDETYCKSFSNASQVINSTDGIFKFGVEGDGNCASGSGSANLWVDFTNLTIALNNWRNETWQSMTGTTNWSNYTETVNSTSGARIAWCVYANDSSNNWNETSCQNPFTYNTTPATQNYSENLTQSISISQVISNIGLLKRFVTTPLTISSTLSKASNFYKQPSSFLNANQAFSSLSTLYKSLISSVAINQLSSRLTSLNILQISSFTLSQSLLRLSTIYKSFASSALFADALARISLSFRYATAYLISNQISLTKFSFIRAISNGITISPYVFKSLYSIRNTASSFLINAVSSRALASARYATSFFTANVNVAKASYLYRFIINGLSIVNDISLSKVYLNFVSLSLNLSESTSRMLNFVKGITQPISTNLMLVRLSSFYKLLPDSFNVNSIVYRGFRFLEIITDSILYNSLIGLSRAYNKYFTGNFILSNSISRLSLLNRIFGNVISINLMETRLTIITRGLTTSLSMTNSLYRFTTLLRMVSNGFSISLVMARTQFIISIFSQQFSTTSMIGFKSSTLNSVITTLSLTFSGSIQRSMTFTRSMYGALSIDAIFNRTWSLIRIFMQFFGIGGMIYGIRPFICSLQSTESNCAFTGCYWCTGTCQASTCPTPQVTGSGGGGWVSHVTSVIAQEPVFDIEVRVETKQVVPGDKVYATINLLKLGGPQGITDVNVTYWIEDSNGNTIGSKNEMLGIETSRRDIHVLAIPLGVPTGSYYFKALARYNNASAFAFESFDVISKLPEIPIFVINVSVPRALVNSTFTIKISLKNKLDNQSEASVTLILPHRFEPSIIVKNITLESLSDYVLNFETKSNEVGNFTGFVKIEYNGNKIIKDFPIVIYPSESIYLIFIREYWWIAVLAITATSVVLILKIKKSRQKLKAILRLEKIKTGLEEKQVSSEGYVPPSETVKVETDMEELENELKEVKNFRDMIEEEFKENLISKESYDELKERYERIISELNSEIERNKN